MKVSCATIPRGCPYTLGVLHKTKCLKRFKITANDGDDGDGDGEPVMLWSCGYDGSILAWQIDPGMNVKMPSHRPVALLQGHRTPITFAVEATLSLASPSKPKLETKSEAESKSESESVMTPPPSPSPSTPASGSGLPSKERRSVVIVTGCSDGTFCVWDATTLRCTFKKQLPPHMGSPISACFDSESNSVCVLMKRRGGGSPGSQDKWRRRQPKWISRDRWVLLVDPWDNLKVKRHIPFPIPGSSIDSAVLGTSSPSSVVMVNMHQITSTAAAVTLWNKSQRVMHLRTFTSQLLREQHVPITTEHEDEDQVLPSISDIVEETFCDGKSIHCDNELIGVDDGISCVEVSPDLSCVFFISDDDGTPNLFALSTSSDATSTSVYDRPVPLDCDNRQTNKGRCTAGVFWIRESDGTLCILLHYRCCSSNSGDSGGKFSSYIRVHEIHADVGNDYVSSRMVSDVAYGGEGTPLVQIRGDMFAREMVTSNNESSTNIGDDTLSHGIGLDLWTLSEITDGKNQISATMRPEQTRNGSPGSDGQGSTSTSRIATHGIHHGCCSSSIVLSIGSDDGDDPSCGGSGLFQAFALPDGTIRVDRVIKHAGNMRRASRGGDGGFILKGHNQRVTCMLSLSHRKSTMVTGSDDGEVRLWDLKTHQCLKCLQISGSGVVDLFQPSKSQTKRSDHQRAWSSCTVAVAADGTLAIISISAGDTVPVIELARSLRISRSPTTDHHDLVAIRWNFTRNYLCCLTRSGPKDLSDQDTSLDQFECAVIDVSSAQVDRSTRGSQNALQMLKSFESAIASDGGNIVISDGLNPCSLLRRVHPVGSLITVLEADIGSQSQANADADANANDDLVKMLMVSMHIWNLDDDVDDLIRSQLQTNQDPVSDFGQATFGAHFVPAVIGPGDATTIWLHTLPRGSTSEGAEGIETLASSSDSGKVGLIGQMCLLMLSVLPWAHQKGLVTPDEFSMLNSFYAIKVPEEFIKGRVSIDVMLMYINHLEATSEHVRDAAHILLKSAVKHCTDQHKQYIMDGMCASDGEWDPKRLILGASIALSFDGNACDREYIIKQMIVYVKQYKLVPFHASCVSLLTEALTSPIKTWAEAVCSQYDSLIESIVRAADTVHNVTCDMQAVHRPEPSSPIPGVEPSPLKGGEKGTTQGTKRFSVLLLRDRLVQIIAALLRQDLLRFMSLFHSKMQLQQIGTTSGSTFFLPMIFTSMLTMLTNQPWLLMGSAQKVLEVCFAAMHPSNAMLRKACLHIATTVVCEMSLRLPFVDLNRECMLICAPSSHRSDGDVVPSDGKQYIYAYHANTGALDSVLEFQFNPNENKSVSPVALKMSPSCALLACYTLEDDCIRVWRLKNASAWSFRLTKSPQVCALLEKIHCRTKPSLDEQSQSQNQNQRLWGYKYKLVWNGEMEIELFKHVSGIGKYALQSQR